METNKEQIIIVIMMVVSLIVIIFFTNQYYQQTKLTNNYFKTMNANLNDNTSLYYSKKCKGDTPEREVRCVISNTNMIYNYNTDQNTDTIKTPTEYNKTGGDCQDTAIFYATIFKNLGFDIKFRFSIPSHVSITISKKINDTLYEYCDVEGIYATCHKILMIDML